uniref:Uncharacterized protein n=1 Tax=Globodera rostochiensis TaxID=31243 RepID=A0A914H9G9_GLORO
MEETPLKTFDEIFEEGWWDKGEAEDLKMPVPTNFDKMSITKSTGRTPKLHKLNPIQLISLDKLNPIQLISLDKLNPIQLIRIFLSQKKFTQKKAELMRDGFKNSYGHEIDETVAKELGLTFKTIYVWKSELGHAKLNKPHSEQKDMMFVEENAAANVQEIENSNSESI